jgi:uncharacterized protein YndB with AHSA1/START domain
MRIVLAAAAALALCGSAQAAVVDKGPQHFGLKFVQQVAAPPDKVWAALGQVGGWWSDEHTYSGKAANMTMPLAANACFCEAVPGGGGVRHGVVALALPQQRMLRVEAALGPLQDEGVSGALFFQLKPKDGGTELTVTYNVGGARDFIVGFAPQVDAVIGQQVQRLKRYAETGKPQ